MPLPLRVLLACALLATTLEACTSGAPTAKGSPKASPSADAPAQLPTASPSADGGASLPVQPTKAVRQLPLRLGLALPGSLVGAPASARLKGEGGLVAPPESNLVALEDGRIVSNNGGAIVSNNSGAIVSNNSGSILSNHGAGAIADQGRAFAAVAGPALARRLLQASPAPTVDPREELWFFLTLIDMVDQFLQGYVGAQPKLDSWQRYRCAQARLLPPPVGSELFALASAQLEQAVQQLPMAGHLSQEGEGLRLRLVLLPQEGAAIAEGTPFLDLTEAPGQDAQARIQVFPLVRDAFGQRDSKVRIRLPLGGGFEADSGESYLPPSEWGPLAKVVHGSPGYQAIRRRLRLSTPSAQQAVLRTMLGALQNGPNPLQTRLLTAFGYAPSGQPDLGLASYGRASDSTVGQSMPFVWRDLTHLSYPGDGPLVPRFALPSGELSSTAPPELNALMPPFVPSDDAAVPSAPAPGEDPTQDPELLLEALPEALLNAPGARL